MSVSAILPIYLALTARGEAWANRQLASRLEQGREDPDRLDERRGHASALRPDGQLIWFHAASVGESLSILELVRRLADEDEALNFLITTGTVTSAKVLENRLPDKALHHYIPLDVSPFVERFLDHWRPDMAVWTESELWPRLMTGTSGRGIPMVLINARMSRRSFNRWKWMRGAARKLLGLFTMVHAQDEVTAQYLTRLGLPKARIEVTGTLKEGSAALPCDEEERSFLAEVIAGRPTWLAASTHPGEEEIATRVHREVLRRSPRMLLIITPRHPDRGDSLAETLRAEDWKVAQRSKDEDLMQETQIYLADTLGELGLWYRLAPISFVGGSMVPIGGHNPFEPAALGSAILHGPHVQNFQEIYDRLRAADAVRQVRTAEEMTKAVVTLLAPDKSATMAHAAWEVCSAGASVTDQAMELLVDTLDGAR